MDLTLDYKIVHFHRFDSYGVWKENTLILRRSTLNSGPSVIMSATYFQIDQQKIINIQLRVYVSVERDK